MARVILVNPSSEALGPDNPRMTRVLYPPPPGGLAMIAAVLQARGHQVKIIDLVLDPKTVTELVREVTAWRTDAVGFSILGPAAEASGAFAAAIRQAAPGIKLFAGNALPSEYPYWFLERYQAFDAVVVGEGEVTTPALLDNGFSGGCAGVVLRGETQDEYQASPQLNDLDALPFPAWELLNYRAYRASPQLLFRSEPTLGVLQSRGCPWSCGFCAQNYLWPTVRHRSIDRVAEELERNLRDLGINHYGFFDSIFPMKREFGEELYVAFERRGLLGKLKLFCETRVDMVWREPFKWLQRAGMHLVFLGIETPNRAILQSEGKLSKGTYDPEMAVETLASVGLRSYGLFVIGLEGETAEDRLELGRYARSLPLDVASFGVYTTYAGSPAQRRTGPPDEASLRETNWEVDASLARDQRRLMRQFYLRPQLILRHLWRREITLDRLALGAWSMMSS